MSKVGKLVTFAIELNHKICIDSLGNEKNIFKYIVFIFLTGCFQSTAMVGPTMTLVSTGNASHAFGTFVTNKAVEEETGMQTHELIAKKVEEQQIKNKDKK